MKPQEMDVSSTAKKKDITFIKASSTQLYAKRSAFWYNTAKLLFSNMITANIPSDIAEFTPSRFELRLKNNQQFRGM